MRRRRAVLVAAGAAAALAGCGGKFVMPTENRERVIPADQSYQMVATWTGMQDIRDILLTQGQGTQLFLLFNHGGTGTAPRGEVGIFARLKATGPQAPVGGITFNTLFNPVALCAGGDGAGAPGSRVFVLDQGDTTLARVNPLTHVYGDTTGLSTTLRGKWRLNEVSDLGLYWRVREFGLLGGDTIATFTDTSMAFVNGVTADAQGRVYVSGAAVDWVPDVLNPTVFTRAFLWRITRYVRGGGDPFMPGSAWHRDNTWIVREGSGVGTVMDPRSLFWGPYGGGAVYTADFLKNWFQKLTDTSPVAGLEIDQAEGLSLTGPLDVTADLQGFIYGADTGNQRVLRFDASGTYVQRVDVERDAYSQTLQAPVAVAADDSLVFVGDRGLGEVIRYQRRK